MAQIVVRSGLFAVLYFIIAFIALIISTIKRNRQADRAEYKNNFGNEREFIFEFCSPFFDNYRYFLGTILAYYAKEHCTLEKIVFLNNHINDLEFADIELDKLLKKIGININSKEFMMNSLESIKTYINKYINQKSR